MWTATRVVFTVPTVHRPAGRQCMAIVREATSHHKRVHLKHQAISGLQPIQDASNGINVQALAARSWILLQDCAVCVCVRVRVGAQPAI